MISKITIKFLILLLISQLLVSNISANQANQINNEILVANHQQISTNYLLNQWQKSDIVIKFTFSILIIMSVITWYLAILKFLIQLKMIKKIYKYLDNFDLSLPTKIPWLQNLINSAENAQIEVQHLPKIDISSWIADAINNEIEKIGSNLSSGMSALATIGATAPFIGLFGTVWGILNALTAIGFSGQATIDKIATPVGEALIMTALGLAVAVPAVIFYNLLLRRNRTINEYLRQIAHLIHRNTLLDYYKNR